MNLHMLDSFDRPCQLCSYDLVWWSAWRNDVALGKRPSDVCLNRANAQGSCWVCPPQPAVLPGGRYDMSRIISLLRHGFLGLGLGLSVFALVLSLLVDRFFLEHSSFSFFGLRPLCRRCLCVISNRRQVFWVTPEDLARQKNVTELVPSRSSGDVEIDSATSGHMFSNVKSLVQG